MDNQLIEEIVFEFMDASMAERVLSHLEAKKQNIQDAIDSLKKRMADNGRTGSKTNNTKVISRISAKRVKNTNAKVRYVASIKDITKLMELRPGEPMTPYKIQEYLKAKKVVVTEHKIKELLAKGKDNDVFESLHDGLWQLKI